MLWKSAGCCRNLGFMWAITFGVDSPLHVNAFSRFEWFVGPYTGEITDSVFVQQHNSNHVFRKPRTIQTSQNSIFVPTELNVEIKLHNSKELSG